MMNTPIICTTSLGLRRGAWTEEEDILLRKCIQKYGEGKWHLVPARTGLNRCRKSCRLRWLNYLSPHIKRGDFDSDEIDLILRLHKLLGNRWSLIAGRLPGRTGNHVKNYWNTNLQRKLQNSNIAAADPPHEQQKIINNKWRSNNNIFSNNHEIIRPQPRKFFDSSSSTSTKKKNIVEKEKCGKQIISTNINDDNGVHEWWANLLENRNELVEEPETPIILLHDEISPPLNGEGNSMQQGQSDGCDEFSLDDIWNLLIN